MSFPGFFTWKAPLHPLSFMSPLQKNHLHLPYVVFPQHLSLSGHCPSYFPGKPIAVSKYLQTSVFPFALCLLPSQWKLQQKAHLPQAILDHGYLEGCLAHYRLSINIWESKGLWNPTQTTSFLSQTSSPSTFQHHQQSLSLCLSTTVFCFFFFFFKKKMLLCCLILHTHLWR